MRRPREKPVKCCRNPPRDGKGLSKGCSNGDGKKRAREDDERELTKGRVDGRGVQGTSR